MPSSVALVTSAPSFLQPFTVSHVVPRQSEDDYSLNDVEYENSSELNTFMEAMTSNMDFNKLIFDIPACFDLSTATSETEDACYDYNFATGVVNTCYKEEGVKQVECWCKYSTNMATVNSVDKCANALCKDEADAKKAAEYSTKLLDLYQKTCDEVLEKLGGSIEAYDKEIKNDREDEAETETETETETADASTSTEDAEEANASGVPKSDDAGSSAAAVTFGLKKVALLGLALSSFFIAF